MLAYVGLDVHSCDVICTDTFCHLGNSPGFMYIIIKCQYLFPNSGECSMSSASSIGAIKRTQ
jgi:hypothetical protein